MEYKDTLNLSELSTLSSKIKAQAQSTADAMTFKYLEEVVRHITDRGDNIEDYTLALVHKPLVFKDSGWRTSMQYIVCRLDELQNIHNKMEG